MIVLYWLYLSLDYFLTNDLYLVQIAMLLLMRIPIVYLLLKKTFTFIYISLFGLAANHLILLVSTRVHCVCLIMLHLDNIITTDDGINIDFIYIDKKEHLGLKTQIEKLQELLQISDK